MLFPPPPPFKTPSMRSTESSVKSEKRAGKPAWHASDIALWTRIFTTRPSASHASSAPELAHIVVF